MGAMAFGVWLGQQPLKAERSQTLAATYERMMQVGYDECRWDVFGKAVADAR